MAAKDDATPGNRPQWPYEMWDEQWETDDTHEVNDSTDNEDPIKTQTNQQGEKIKQYGEILDSVEADNRNEKEESLPRKDNEETGAEELNEEKLEEDITLVPDHWTEEFDTVITDSSPFNTLLDAVASSDISITQAAVDIKTTIGSMIQGTLDELSSLYKVFQDSYLLPVGSMAEHTKIHKADEFDFAIILPLLADEKYINILCNKSSAEANPSTLALIGDISEGDLEEVFQHFQMFLRHLWASCMKNYIPEGWKLLNPLGHSEEQSVAATFHLERLSDKTTVDIDVCFWVPLDTAALTKFPTNELPQRNYILRNCLDENGIIYAVMPQDENINYSTNILRFAMSIKERDTLQKFGPENGRLKCYRLCKCIVASLLPKFRKSEECLSCFNSLVSSFCLKNIVLYMIAYYKDDVHWTPEKIPNRVYEVFCILTFCMKVNVCIVSAYFTPYNLDVDMYMAYDPENKCVVNKNEVVGPMATQCMLPDFNSLKQKLEDKPSLKAVTDYEHFLNSSEWRYPEVLCRLSELLAVLMCTDKGDREEMVQEPGWNCIGLQLPEESYLSSIDTKL